MVLPTSQVGVPIRLRGPAWDAQSVEVEELDEPEELDELDELDESLDEDDDSLADEEVDDERLLLPERDDLLSVL